MMRDQLTQYVQLLFAGAKDCDDIKQEILQNTLDRYDDLIAAGKVPEAAYQLAIAGIGDINEILGTAPQSVPVMPHVTPEPKDTDTPIKRLLRAIAVGLYILCPLPLIVLSEIGNGTLGLCGTLAIVAVATVLIMLGAKKERNEEEKKEQNPLQKGISALLWAIGLGIYFSISFATGAWYITWVIFPILVALDSLLEVLVKQKELHGTVNLPSETDHLPRKRIQKWIWGIGIALFVIVTLRTLAWGATWLFLPITAVAEQLVYAILDYQEVLEHET